MNVTKTLNGDQSGLVIQNLNVTYRSGARTVHAVRGVDLEVSSRGMTALVGESGSGKSTLVMAILGLLPNGTDISGDIRIGKDSILGLDDDALRAYRWKRVALVPQGAMNAFTPVLTVGRHIRETLEFHMKLSRRDAEHRTRELLEKAGLSADLANRYPHELSGGQKQRAAVALAIACEPDILLADEPTTALDVVVQREVMDAIADLASERPNGASRSMGILLVTHDLPLALSRAGYINVMYRGEIVERGTPESLLDSPRHAHTKALLEGSLVSRSAFSHQEERA